MDLERYSRTERAIRIFEDTRDWYTHDADPRRSVEASIAGTVLYPAGTTPRPERGTVSSAHVRGGAFRDPPRVVAQTYRELLDQFDGYLRRVEFAVYCTPRDSRNYDAFRSAMR